MWKGLREQALRDLVTAGSTPLKDSKADEFEASILLAPEKSPIDQDKIRRWW